MIECGSCSPRRFSANGGPRVLVVQRHDGKGFAPGGFVGRAGRRGERILPAGKIQLDTIIFQNVHAENAMNFRSVPPGRSMSPQTDTVTGDQQQRAAQIELAAPALKAVGVWLCPK